MRKERKSNEDKRDKGDLPSQSEGERRRKGDMEGNSGSQAREG